MNPADAVRALVDGRALLGQPGVRPYVWWPLVVSMVIVGAGLAAALSATAGLGSWAARILPEWLDFLAAVVEPLLQLLLILTGTWLFGFLAVVLSSPFHGNLSAALETGFATTPLPPDPGLARMLAQSLGREGRKLRYQLPRLLAVALLYVVPVVNVIAPPASLLLAAWLLAAQFIDLPAENRHIPFTETLSRLRRFRLCSLTFGAAVAALLAIPLLNILTVPLAVAGGTLLWHRMEQELANESRT
ncbi:MAG: sulfate transporter CysZ [Pseudomonadales bacterium]